MKKLILLVLFSASFIVARINGQTFTYNNDFPNDLIGTASRPESTGKIEIESADDFLIKSNPTRITGATFTGLIPAGATIDDVRALVHPVLRHRILVGYRAEAEGISVEQVVDRLLEVVPSPIGS